MSQRHLLHFPGHTELLNPVSQVMAGYQIQSTFRTTEADPVLEYRMGLMGMEFCVTVRALVSGQETQLLFTYEYPFTIIEARQERAVDYLQELNKNIRVGQFQMDLETCKVLLHVYLPVSQGAGIPSQEMIRSCQATSYKILVENRELLRKYSAPEPNEPIPGTLYAFTKPGTKVLFKSIPEVENTLRLVPGDRFVLKSVGSATYVGCLDKIPYIVPDREMFARPWVDDMTPVEFLRKLGLSTSTRKYTCKDGSQRDFDVTLAATYGFNLLASDRVVKKHKYGNVIGVLNQCLYVHYDGSVGAELEREHHELSLVCRYGFPGTTIVKVTNQLVEVDVSSLSTAEYKFAPGDYAMVPNIGKGMIVGLCDDRIIVQTQDRPDPGAWRVTIDKDLHSVGFQLVSRPGGSAEAMVPQPNGQQKLDVGYELFLKYGFNAGDGVNTQSGPGFVLGATKEDMCFNINRKVQVFKGYKSIDFKSRGFTLTLDSTVKTTHEVSVKQEKTKVIKMVGPFLNTPQALPAPPIVDDDLVDTSNIRSLDEAGDDGEPDSDAVEMEGVLLDELVNFERGQQPGGGIDLSQSFLGSLMDGDFLIPSRDVVVDMKDGQPVTLGKGAFGQVYSGTLWDVEEVAIKRVRLKTKRQYEDVKEEFKILSTLNHPNVLRIYGICTFKCEICLVLDKCNGGTLEEYIKRNSHMPWSRKIEFAIDIGKGLNFLHRRGIIHRDIKLANMLLRGDTALLADFGLSRVAGRAVAGEGTPLYMAPELTRKGSFGTSAVDVYAFGIGLWYMDDPDANPYPGVRTAPDLYQRVQRGQRPPSSIRIPEPVLSIMTKCWDPTPEHRPEINMVVVELKEALKQV